MESEKIQATIFVFYVFRTSWLHGMNLFFVQYRGCLPRKTLFLFLLIEEMIEKKCLRKGKKSIIWITKNQIREIATYWTERSLTLHLNRLIAEQHLLANSHRKNTRYKMLISSKLVKQFTLHPTSVSCKKG